MAPKPTTSGGLRSPRPYSDGTPLWLLLWPATGTAGGRSGSAPSCEKRRLDLRRRWAPNQGAARLERPGPVPGSEAALHDARLMRERAPARLLFDCRLLGNGVAAAPVSDHPVVDPLRDVHAGRIWRLSRLKALGCLDASDPCRKVSRSHAPASLGMRRCTSVRSAPEAEPNGGAGASRSAAADCGCGTLAGSLLQLRRTRATGGCGARSWSVPSDAERAAAAPALARRECGASVGRSGPDGSAGTISRTFDERRWEEREGGGLETLTDLTSFPPVPRSSDGALPPARASSTGWTTGGPRGRTGNEGGIASSRSREAEQLSGDRGATRLLRQCCTRRDARSSAAICCRSTAPRARSAGDAGGRQQFQAVIVAAGRWRRRPRRSPRSTSGWASALRRASQPVVDGSDRRARATGPCSARRRRASTSETEEIPARRRRRTHPRRDGSRDVDSPRRGTKDITLKIIGYAEQSARTSWRDVIFGDASRPSPTTTSTSSYKDSST